MNKKYLWWILGGLVVLWLLYNYKKNTDAAKDPLHINGISVNPIDYLQAAKTTVSGFFNKNAPNPAATVT